MGENRLKKDGGLGMKVEVIHDYAKYPVPQAAWLAQIVGYKARESGFQILWGHPVQWVVMGQSCFLSCLNLCLHL